MNEKREGAIRPTLFLGLGGTGKEILLRLRRKFYERYGNPGLPCTAYLWIDTDTRDRMAQGEKMDEIFRAVAFQEHERFALLEGSVKDHLSEVFKNKGQWEHVHRWLYPEVERFGGEIADGAGGVRAVGRLTFFFHYLKIRDRIRRVLEKIGTQETIDRTQRIVRGADFDTDTQVFAICSVAGGTGCGTFLDMAFLLNNLPIANRTVTVIFLPNVYHSTAAGEVSQRSHGNGYAALKELEFYTVRSKDGSVAKGEGKREEENSGIDFQVEWEKGEPLSIPGPPFSLTYLLERHNEGNIPLETRSELFYMVAESLFLDFMPGSFSNSKRSQYSNVAQYLSSQDAHQVKHEGIALPQMFARRYASFGMSKVEIPIDLLKGACGAHLAHQIVSHWGREPLSSNVRAEVLEDMSHGERTLDADGLIRRFGAGWSGQIRSGIEGIFRSGARIESAQDIHELTGELEKLEQKTLRAEGDNPVRWGTVIADIRSARAGVEQQVQGDLQQWLRRCLDEQGRGLRALMKKDGYLTHLIENLKQLYEYRGEGEKPELELRKDKALQDADIWGKERVRRRRELQRALNSIGLKILRLQPWTVDALREPWKDSEQQYALAKAEACLLEEAKGVARSGVQYLEDKRRLLQQFDESLDELKQKMLERKEGFLNFGEGVLFIRIFDREKDWPEFYSLGVADGRRKQVNEVEESRLYLEREFKDAQAGLWDLVERFPDEGLEELSAKLIDFCEHKFISDFEANPRQINVLEHPQLKGRLQETVQKLVRCALPMIRIDPKLGSSTVNVQRHAYLGIAEKDRNPYRGFIERVSDALQPHDFRIDSNNVLTTGEPHEVYLYLVSYAFALPALPAVKTDAHAAYYSFYKGLRSGGAGQERSHIPLHLSNRWEGSFEDLMVYSDSEAKDITQSLEILLFGSILRVLDLEDSNGRPDYGYKKWVPPASRREPLGNRQEAIEALRADHRLRAALRSEIGSREIGLQEEELRSYYWLLSSISLAQLFIPLSPEEVLLEEKLQAVSDRLSQQGKGGEGLSLEASAPEERAAEARKRLGDHAEWIGEFPVLKTLEAWVYQRPV